MLLRLLAGSALCISLQISSLFAMEGQDEEREQSLSLQVAKIYAGTKSEKAKAAVETFGDLDISPEDVVKEWNWQDLPQDVLCCAPFMRLPVSLSKYREIIMEEKPSEAYSYHGYDEFSALLYDIYTAIGANLRDESVESRSRFRFNRESGPSLSVNDFLNQVHFDNDHESQFTAHGISAVPHIFSNTTFLAENCLTALNQQFIQTPDISLYVNDLGFTNAAEYIALGKKYLKGGYITRFTFSSLEDLDCATYPAPNASATGTYGKPWVRVIGSQKGPNISRITSSDFFAQLSSLSSKEPEMIEYLFNMQFRNIFVPSIYNDANRVKTKIFSKHNHEKIDEYYQVLEGLVKEDLKDLSTKQIEQLNLWLK